MLATFYHRAQSPWVYPVEDGTIEIQFKIAKNSLKNATLLVCDRVVEKYEFYHLNHSLNQQIKMNKLGVTQFHEFWVARVKELTNSYCYSFKLETSDDKIFYLGAVGVINEKESTMQSKTFTYVYSGANNCLNIPIWYRETNWYEIFLDCFNSQLTKKKYQDKNVELSKTKFEVAKVNDVNLASIIAKLDYIKDLGFKGIYLSQIFTLNTFSHYETILQSLIEQCHKRGLKVMIDAIFNYVDKHSKQWQDFVKNQTQSRYLNWFCINDFNVPYLNLTNIQVQKHLFKTISKWTKLGIDGWMLDLSNISTFNLWGQFKKTVININSDIAIIGKRQYESINWLQSDMGHGVINYWLRDVILKFVLSNQDLNDKLIFIEEFNTLAFAYSPEQQSSMFNFLTSQSTDRLITLLYNDTQKYALAMSLMFYSPGVTSTFYGEEIGLENKGDFNSCHPMTWGRPRINFKTLFKKLIKNKQELVNHTNIFDRTYARLDDENNILLENRQYFVIVKDLEVKLELLK